ncbi:hypothetical protein [Patulibacter minatonensis]|uniref:hypothetical protein n=1 Tax=Patulibacter minatonensis TaxID=298163 RepID=UPI00047D1CB3|nr:hypothetical protein [Patulibacter minatonensis]
MSQGRRPRGAWLGGVRDGDDLVAGRPLRDRPDRTTGRYFDDDEPAESVVRASRSRREGWNRHVPSGPAVRATPRGRARRARAAD